MKILFIRPNKDALGFKPVGISLLSAICKQAGHKVDLFDTSFFDFGGEERSDLGTKINVYKPIDWTGYNMDKQKVDLQREVESILKKSKPDLCAFSVLSDQKLIAEEISSYIPDDIPTVWGGVHPTTSMEDCIDIADYVCIGEGIEAVPELIDAIENGKDISPIKNICSKDFINPTRPYFTDMNSLPYLDWNIFDKRHFYKPYDGKIVIGGDYMSNWGCPYKCTYCINNWINSTTKRPIRRFSPTRTVDELVYLKEKYNLNFMRFHDEDFLMRPINHLREFADLYKERVGLPFTIETNPHTVTPEKVRILKDMGIASVSIALESGNDYMRRCVLKRIDSRDDVISAFHEFNNAGVRTVSFNMIGLPFENRARIFDTIELNRIANPTVPDVGFFFPFKRTELYDVSVENGFYSEKEVPVYSGEYPALNQPDLSREEVMGLLRCFVLYVKMPKKYYPLIKAAEKDDLAFERVSCIYNELYKQ